jgi:hypothetical protein
MHLTRIKLTFSSLFWAHKCTFCNGALKYDTEALSSAETVTLQRSLLLLKSEKYIGSAREYRHFKKEIPLWSSDINPLEPSGYYVYHQP